MVLSSGKLLVLSVVGVRGIAVGDGDLFYCNCVSFGDHMDIRDRVSERLLSFMLLLVG